MAPTTRTVEPGAWWLRAAVVILALNGLIVLVCIPFLGSTIILWVVLGLGRLVAATTKPPSYYLASKEWWRETYGDGQRGSVYMVPIFITIPKASPPRGNWHTPSWPPAAAS